MTTHHTFSIFFVLASASMSSLACSSMVSSRPIEESAPVCTGPAEPVELVSFNLSDTNSDPRGMRSYDGEIQYGLSPEIREGRTVYGVTRYTREAAGRGETLAVEPRVISSNLVFHGGKLFFAVRDELQVEIWSLATDGSSLGTEMVVASEYRYPFPELPVWITVDDQAAYVIGAAESDPLVRIPFDHSGSKVLNRVYRPRDIKQAGDFVYLVIQSGIVQIRKTDGFLRLISAQGEVFDEGRVYWQTPSSMRGTVSVMTACR